MSDGKPMRFTRYDRIVCHYPAMWPLLVPGYVPMLNAMLDIVHVLPSKPRRLLDLGCGPGSATVAVAPGCAPDANVTLIDGSARMMEAAKTLLGAAVASTLVADFTQAATLQVLEPASFDLALCSFALHHSDDQKKREVLERLGVALSPGGMLLLADEVTADRPAGFDLVERVRSRLINEHITARRVTPEFWQLETTIPPEDRLPFLPSRVDDLVSWMARAGLAASCPVAVFGSALLVGIKPA